MVDCRKLTMEACTHAAQNERLPLRAVLQVLFFEQLQLRHALTLGLPEQRRVPNQRSQPSRAREGEDTRRSAVRENQVLRLDMDSMRNRVHELERECSNMKKTIQKIDGSGGPNVRDREKHSDSDAESDTSSNRRRKGRYGCRFSTQVCDSHERTVVESRTAARVKLSP